MAKSEWAKQQQAVSDALDKRLKKVKLTKSDINRINKDAQEERIATGYALLARDAENRAENYKERYGYHAGEVGRASRDTMDRLSAMAMRRQEEAEKNREGFNKFYSNIAGMYGGDVARAADKAYQNAIAGYENIYNKAGDAAYEFSNRPITPELSVGFDVAKNMGRGTQAVGADEVSAARKALATAQKKVASAVVAEDMVAWNAADDERIAAQNEYDSALRRHLNSISLDAVMRERDEIAKELDAANPLDKETRDALTKDLEIYDKAISSKRTMQNEILRGEYLTPSQREEAIANIEKERARDIKQGNLGANIRANTAIAQLKDSQWLHDVGEELAAGLTADEWRMVMERPVREVGKVYNGFDVRGRYISDDAWRLLVDRFGKEKANQYYQYVKRVHDAEDMQKQSAALEKITNNIGGEITGSVLSVPGNILGGAAGAIDLAAQAARKAVTGTPVNWNSPAQQSAAWAPEVRGNVSSHIQYGRDGTQGGTGRDVAAFLYNTGMSAADSALAMAVGQNYGGLLLAGGAGTGAARDAKERGASDWQALGYGVAAGAAEAVFEKISIDEFLSIKAADDIFDAVFSILNQSLTEASEETLTSISNTVADQLINGGASQISTEIREFVAQGYTEDEARQLAVQRWAASLGQDALAGFVSGSAFGTVGNVTQAVQNKNAQKKQTTMPAKGAERGDEPSVNTTPAEGRKTPVDASYVQDGEVIAEDSKTRPAVLVKAIQAVERRTDEVSDANKSVPQIRDDANRSDVSMEVYTEDGGIVQANGVSSVENGRVQVALSDGTIVPVSSVRFSNPELEKIYSTAALYDTKTAKAFVSGYNGSTDANTYSRGFMSIYGAARQGKTMQQATALSDAAAALTPPVQRLAYMAGENSIKAVEPVSRLDASVSTVMKMQAGTGGGVTMQLPGGKTVTQRQAEQIKVLDAFGKSVGRTIYVVDTLSDEVDGKTVSANALFDPSDNSYVIALDSVGEAYMYYAVHESVHDIRQNSELGYAALEDVIFEVLRDKGEDVDALVQHQKDIMDKEGLSEAEIEDRAREEVVANTVPVILTDEGTGKALAERFAESEADTRNWFEKLLDKIEALLQDAYEVLKGQKSWGQMKTIEGDREAIRRIRREYFDALDAREDVQAGRNEGVRYSLNKFEKDGRRFVDVQIDQNRFDGISPEQQVAEAKAVIKEKFKGKVIGIENRAFVNGSSMDEYAYPAKFIKDDVIKSAKMRASTELDNILDAGTNFRTMPDGAYGHVHKNVSGDFRYFDTLFKVGDEYYSGVVNIMQTNKGLLLKDVTQIKNVTQDIIVSYGNNPKYEFLRNTSMSFSLQQNASGVNPSMRDSAEKDARRFSLKDTDPVDAEQLAEENERLREALAIAKQEVQLTKGHHVTEKSLDRMTNWVLRYYSSNYDHDTLKSRLRDISEYIGNAEVVSWDELSDAGIGLFRDVLEQSSKVDTDAPNYDPDVLKYIRSMRININDQQVHEAADSFGGIGNFRKKYFGRLNLTNDGLGVDVLWDDLATEHPVWFDKNFDGIGKDGSKLDRILEVLEMARAPVVNPYQYNMDMYAADAFLSWFNNAYLNADEVKTFADKQRTKLEQTKARLYNKIQEVREESKQRYRERLRKERTQNAEERKALTKKYREASAEQREKLRKRYQELANDRIAGQRAHMRDTAIRTKYRNRIEHNAAALMKWLRTPTDTRHVPESLRGVVFNFLQTIDFSTAKETKKAERWRDRMRKVADYMEAVEAGAVTGDEYVTLDIDADFVKRLKEYVDGTEEVRTVRDLSQDQLRELDYLVGIIKRAVTEANTVMRDGKRQKIETIVEGIVEDARKHGIRKQNAFTRSKFGELLNSGNLTPEYFFEQLGPSFKSLYDDILKAQDTIGFRLQAAHDFYEEAVKKYRVNDWLNKKDDVLTFTTQRGDQVELTRNEAMSIYATAKREAANTDSTAAKHLENGGFVYERERTQKKGEKKEYTFDDAAPKPLTAKDVAIINNWLTKEQKGFADTIMSYMSNELSAYGNDTSLQQVGYKKYLEKVYFPYKTASEYLAIDPGKGTETQMRWKNKGFTKSTVKGANTPIVLQDFTKVFANHANEMITYSGMSIPQENMVKVFNYRTPVTGERSLPSLRATIKATYGQEAVTYINDFLSDLNGGVSTDPREGLMGWLISKFKKSAVAASLSVAIQQPSSIIRSWAMIDPKYFVYKKRDWRYESDTKWFDEAKKYAGVAVIKEIGGFDTSTGAGAASWITEASDKSMRAGDTKQRLQRAGQWIDDKTSWAPGAMDRLGWGCIWYAVKNELADTNADLVPGSEEFLKEAGKRFNEIINRTQVYDSVLSKSSIMRSKSQTLKMATAFMSESTVQYNMLYSAVKTKDKKARWATITSVAGSVIVNAMLKGIVQAMRDDDEDETFLEKYIEAVCGSLLGQRMDKIPFQDDSKWWKVTVQVLSGLLGSEFSPAQTIPFVSSFISVMKGYDVERTDMSLFVDVWNAIDALDSSKPTHEKVLGLVGALANYAGLPVSNVWRDLKAVWNVGASSWDRVVKREKKPVSGATIGESVLRGINYDNASSKDAKAQAIVRAYTTDRYKEGKPGALQYVERKTVELMGKDYDPSEFAAKIRKAIKDLYKAGELDRATAEELLTQYGGVDPYGTGSNSLNAIIESAEYDGEDDFSIYNGLKGMLDDETTPKEFKAEIDRLEDTYNVQTGAIKSTITTELKDDYAKGSAIERAAIVQTLLNTGLYGKNRREVEKNVESWVLDWYWSQYGNRYMADPDSRAEIKETFLNAGVSSSDFNEKVKSETEKAKKKG